MNSPAIRFAGFTDAWEERKLGEILRYEQPTAYIVKRTKYNDHYSTPVLTAGQSFILGHTDETSGIKNANKNKPVIIFDDFTTSSHLVDFPFKVKSSAMKLLTLRDENDDFTFSFNSLKKINYIPQNHERHWISKFSGFCISIPDKIEQKKIGKMFFEIDRFVTLHQLEHDKTVNIKKALLEKLFPKDGEDTPAIRFAGSTGAWKQLEFGNIVTPYAAPVPTPTDGYYRLGIRSHAKGTFHSYVRPGMELGTAQMHRVAANNFIVNITFGWEHAVAITNENDAEKLVSHRFPQFSFNTNMVPDFFKFLIIDENFRHHLSLASPGGAGRNRVLKIDEMLEYKFWVPFADEQRQIAMFLGHFDRLITLHQRELTKLQNIKKALLEKMFV